MSDLKALSGELDALVEQIGGTMNGSFVVWRPKSGKAPSHLAPNCPKLARSIPQQNSTTTDSLAWHLCPLCAEAAGSYGVSDEVRLAISVSALRLALSQGVSGMMASGTSSTYRQRWLEKAGKTTELSQALAMPELCGFTNELILALKVLGDANTRALRDDSSADALVRFAAAGVAFEVRDPCVNNQVGQLAPKGWSSVMKPLGGVYAVQELFGVWIKALAGGGDFVAAADAVRAFSTTKETAGPERFDQLPNTVTLTGDSFATPVEWALAEWRAATRSACERLLGYWQEQSEAVLANGLRERTAFVMRYNNKPLPTTVTTTVVMFATASDAKKGLTTLNAPEVVVRWLSMAGTDSSHGKPKPYYHVSHSAPLSDQEAELAVGLYEAGVKGPMGQIRTVVAAVKALAL
jgi:hypothetical protein